MPVDSVSVEALLQKAVFKLLSLHCEERDSLSCVFSYKSKKENLIRELHNPIH